MLQKGRRSQRKRRISLKRRMQWLSAWTAVLAAVTLIIGLFVFSVSGIKNVCDSVLAEHPNKVKEFSLDSSSVSGKSVENKHVENKEYGDVTSFSYKGDWNLLLVNKEKEMPEDYDVSIVSLKNGQQVAADIYDDLRDMLFTGEEEGGLSFLVASGYRTKEKQMQLVKEEIIKNQSFGMTYEEAYEDAMLTVAPDGYSEHETGLAVDIVAVANQRLDETQEYTRENQWLRENCYKYGFILRYPKDKEDITGFSYESWHFRYVGKEAAKEITEKGITLEEYLEGR